MNKGRLIAALVANAGAIVGVYLVFWLTGPRANRVTLIGVGVLGIVILNAALLLRYKTNRKTVQPNQRSHFGSILMLILILLAVLLHFILK